ncbi:T-complex 1 subunit alpha [Chlorella sorokiniana]|uniref:T-complex protein 1 subunit alpha n=1 Tax=Chlorella sorokiniana TaxID=3076 RepID=A0A2P6TB93_CHLSO|nr:T-complex 1 subunit alpha [Chlorella sorokiniana]|eukprot:PRW05817.1 T-complex 1 subunit alpha [Chlorella sorokiniana]
MLVDDIGDVTITNDGATILKLLEVEHPAAKILVELAELQDQEVGDGTTSVVIVAAELLRRANELVRQKIHPTSIIGGYRLAMREAVKYVESHLAIPTSSLGADTLMAAAKTAMSSKIVGADSDFYGRIVVDAVSAVKSVDPDTGRVRYPVSAINILKAHGKSAKESRLLDGYALNMGRAAQGMAKSLKGARIACLDMNLQKARMHFGVQVLVSDPKELEKIRERELDITRERIQKIIDAGANVILTTKGIDDTALKYFVEAGAIACRRVPKDDLRRVAKATGGSIVMTLADMDGNETFDPANLGTAEEVVEESVADNDMIMIRGPRNTRAVTVLLRGANDYMLDEMDRSLHDAFCIVKRVLENEQVVAGGGAVETALSVYLESFATTLGSREQMAIAEFADALLVIPKTLAVNAAKDATELVAKLRAHHYTAQTKPGQEQLCRMGLDLIEGSIRDNVAAGVVEPALSKTKIIQFATEAAITILRIDDLIRLEAEPTEGEE